MDITPIKSAIIKATERAGFFYEGKREDDICVWTSPRKRTGELVFELNTEGGNVIFVGPGGSAHQFTRAEIERNHDAVLGMLRAFCLNSIHQRFQGHSGNPNETLIPARVVK